METKYYVLVNEARVGLYDSLEAAEKGATIERMYGTLKQVTVEKCHDGDDRVGG